jgi:hypothetical protein
VAYEPRDGIVAGAMSGACLRTLRHRATVGAEARVVAAPVAGEQAAALPKSRRQRSDSEDSLPAQSDPRAHQHQRRDSLPLPPSRSIARDVGRRGQQPVRLIPPPRL